MPVVNKWSNVQVHIQSTLGTANAITAISAANPAVASTATTPATGSFVLIVAAGMYQVDQRVFKVGTVVANVSFQLAGEDTTAYDAFTSGTWQLITFGTSLATATALTATGGEFDFIDTTTIHVNVKTQVPGLASPASYSFTNLWDVTDAGLIACKLASDNQAQRAIRFGFAAGAGPKVVFNGYIGATLLPVGNAQDKVETNVTITMFGKPTIYAT